MTHELRVPPRGINRVTPPRTLAARLQSLIGRPFALSGKTRTDGANLRKLVAEALLTSKLPPAAALNSWRYADPKRKGVPRLLREFLDTYLVTSGNSYNLQVWNRNPASPSVQIEYIDGTALKANDVRFALVRVDTARHVVRAVAVLTPDYIVEHFGKFGVPTVKEQLILSSIARQKVYRLKPPILCYPDDERVAAIVSSKARTAGASIRDAPSPGNVLPIRKLQDVAVRLLGQRFEPRATKTRGQELELRVAQLLGFGAEAVGILLSGGFPDIRHQALEIKIQDAPTVDLGRFSPQIAEDVAGCPGFTTETIRYLIALMNSTTFTCEGVVLCPGVRLGEHFTYVANQNFKCQRSMPIAFFDAIDGKSVFNPRLR